MSFHAKLAAAQKLYEAILAERPDLRDRAEECRKHFLEGDSKKPNPQLLHAALRLMTERNFINARIKIASETRVQVGQTERHIIDAVNTGPASLREDEAYLHQKGIMRGSSRYYLGVKGIELGSVYDRAWRSMAPEYRPVIAEAVDAAMAKDGALSRKALQYVSAVLMPNDDMRLLELNKLSIRHEKDYMAHLKDAASFVRKTARRLDIEMPETMLNGLLSPKQAEYEKPASLRLPPPIKPQKILVKIPKPLGPNFVASVREEVAKAEFSLEERLSLLEKAGAISRREHKVYSYYMSDNVIEPRGIDDVVNYLRRHGVDKGERYARLLLTNVEIKLRGIDASNDGLHIDRHKARAVRPQ